ncbi:hypothetical protein KR044_006805 [Drosophila immigrans]|nr:hypothetical protein KR044_006805 [Drosophila immigrans]
MSSCSSHYFLLAIFLLLGFDLAVKPSLAACGDRKPQLRLRSTANNLNLNLNSNLNGDGDGNADADESDQQLPQIDLSQLSDKQLQQLMQQLNVADQFDEDNRGSSRPWKKVQRIIRRQLVRIPKRYLKKFLRQFGLGRSGNVRSTPLQLQPQPQLYYLIPLE